MKCIGKITDEDFNLELIAFDNPRHRYGARGIIFNESNQIAILYKKAKNEYKLIGGGIEENEEPSMAFQREAYEEAGCLIDIDDCLGTFEELKSQDNFKQTSYIYVAHTIETGKQLHLTSKEVGEGSQLLWCSLDEAIELIKNSEDKLLPSKFESPMSVYHTKFVVHRDYEILQYYKKFILKQQSNTMEEPINKINK